MNMGTWIVKNAGGEELGSIRKLMIDSNTRQLSYADVALTQTNQLVRLPWTELDVRHEGIFLKSTHLPLMNALDCPSRNASLDVLEIPVRITGKIRHRHRNLFSSGAPPKIHP